MRLVAYQGLILDFGGVITTDFHGALSAFCVREGLAPDSVVRALGAAGEGRDTFAAAEAGRVPQRELEAMLARQLGVRGEDLIARMPGGLRPRPETADLAKRARMATVHFVGAPSDFAEIERLIGVA